MAGAVTDRPVESGDGMRLDTMTTDENLGLNENALRVLRARYLKKGENGRVVESPREMFRQISHIAQFMSHDMLDKIQWWEKETLKLSDDEIDKRIPHMSTFLEQLKQAYETFSDVDL